MSDPRQKLVESYLARGIAEFGTNRLSPRLLRRLAEEFPALFLPAALRHLNSSENSGALRFLTTLAIRQEATFELLTRPETFSRETGVNLFRRFLEVDPSFDVRLAEHLPNRRGTNLAEALDSRHSTRALDILDATSRGMRLLPVIGHLSNWVDNRVSAKATLFVGRRIQNPGWTRKQLERPDERVRANALESIWGLDSPAALSLLEDCTRDDNNRVLGNSLLGLHILGRKEVERRALYLSESSKFLFRSTAAWILGKMAGPESIEGLTRLIRDEHPQVRSTALRSLIDIRHADTKSLHAIADRAAKVEQEAADKAIEAALTAIQSGPVAPNIRIRLDGIGYRVRQVH